MAKYRLPIITPAHQQFRQRTAAAEDRTTQYVTPIYADHDNNKYGLGSGVLLVVQQEHFLITAAHIIDEHHTTNLYLLAEKHFLAIGGPVLMTPLPASGDRNDAPLDVAVLHLNAETATAVQAHKQFLTINRVDASDKPYTHSLYTITGYPSTKQPPPKGGILTTTPVRFTSVPLPPDQYPKPFTLGTHFGIPYDKKKQIARNLKVERPPDPHGISGGGLFRLGTFDQIKHGTNTESLIGIAIEARPHSLISTNITIALELIRADHPELDDHIPRCSYGNITVQKE